MLATQQYLFVLRGDWLYQLDVDTLELRRKVRLDEPAAAGRAPRAPAAAPPAVAAPDETVGFGGGVGTGGAGGRFAARGAGFGEPVGPAIDAALKWLAAHQDEDGKWDSDQFMKHDEQGAPPCDGPGTPTHDVGVTGLAMLAMLGSGSTLRTGPYRDNLKRAATWLKVQQGENGLFGTPSTHDFIYNHAIATYAMCEAFGLSQYTLLKPVAQKGIDYLESHRNPYAVWRYQPRDNDNDTSVTSWCIAACQSGEFFGLAVNRNAAKLTQTWLDAVTTPDGRCGYTKAGEPSSRMPGDHATRFPVEKGEALTAAGLFTRFFLGQDPKDKPVMKAAADLLLAKPPMWDPEGGTIDSYYWYYGTYAAYQMGGRYWKEWSKKLLEAVVGNQRKDGNAAGSWDPIDTWGQAGGRVYTTALLTLALEAQHRYTRLVR